MTPFLGCLLDAYQTTASQCFQRCLKTGGSTWKNLAHLTEEQWLLIDARSVEDFGCPLQHIGRCFEECLALHVMKDQSPIGLESRTSEPDQTLVRAKSL